MRPNVAESHKMNSFWEETVCRKREFWMNKLIAICALIRVISLCGIASAQDRGWASSIAWSPDGQTIAVGGGAGVWFFDNAFNELGFAEVEHDIEHAPRIVEWNATGELLVHSSFFSSIRIVDVSAREVIRNIEVPDPGLWTPVHWHPEESLIIGGTYQETTHIWDAITGEELFYFESPTEPSDLGNSDPLGFCWYAIDEVVIVNRLATHVVDIVEGKILQSFSTYLGHDWISCNRDYQILTQRGWLLDLTTGLETQIFGLGIGLESEDGYFPLAVAWSPDAGQFVSSINGCRIRVFDFDGQSSELIAELSGGSYGVPGIGFFIDSKAWHPDGSRFAVVGEFGDIRVWDAETFELLQRFDGFELHPTLLAYLEKSDQPGRERCP